MLVCGGYGMSEWHSGTVGERRCKMLALRPGSLRDNSRGARPRFAILQSRLLSNADCSSPTAPSIFMSFFFFVYRARHYIILRVSFTFATGGKPNLHYATCRNSSPIGRRAYAGRGENGSSRDSTRQSHAHVPGPRARSVARFQNPIASKVFEQLRQDYDHARCSCRAIPPPTGPQVPAAWLVEPPGFSRLRQRERPAISHQHGLRIVNRGDR